MSKNCIRRCYLAIKKWGFFFNKRRQNLTKTTVHKCVLENTFNRAKIIIAICLKKKTQVHYDNNCLEIIKSYLKLYFILEFF